MTETQTTEPREVLRHISSLDGIRGVAIFLVLLFHLLFANTETGNRWMNIISQARGAGWIGVDLFFALSGFLITGILYDSLQDPHFFKNFYGRRVLRIFPLYYGVILVVFLCVHSYLSTQGKPLLLLAAYLQNTPWGLHLPQSGTVIFYTGHLWSLAVEEQFYLVWPLVVFLVKDRKRLIWVAVAFFFAALLSRVLLLHFDSPLDSTYKLTICRADSLLGGAWLALVTRGEWRQRVLRFAPAAFYISVFCCLLIAWKTGNFNKDTGRFINQYGYSILAVASTSLIAMALRPLSFTAQIMRASWLRFLGKYSYGIYVYHELIAGLAHSWLVPALHNHIHSKSLFHLSFLVLVASATILVSVLSFKIYERPFLQLKRYFNYSNA